MCRPWVGRLGGTIRRTRKMRAHTQVRPYIRKKPHAHGTIPVGAQFIAPNHTPYISHPASHRIVHRASKDSA